MTQTGYDPAVKEKKPNIIFILADDMGTGENLLQTMRIDDPE